MILPSACGRKLMVARSFLCGLLAAHGGAIGVGTTTAGPLAAGRWSPAFQHSVVEVELAQLWHAEGGPPAGAMVSGMT